MRGLHRRVGRLTREFLRPGGPDSITGPTGCLETIAGYEKSPGNGYNYGMIFIAVKFRVRPEHADAWPSITRAFTDATRAEPGNLWFDWSRSVDDPNEYVLVEAFRDDAAEAHVTSGHFREAQRTLPQYLVETPRIVNFTVPQDGWSELVEFVVTS